MKRAPIAEAKAFWKYMKEKNKLLPTQSELRQFYKITYLPTLEEETKHARYCSIMWCFRDILKIIKWEKVGERENITYLAEVSVDQNFIIRKETKREQACALSDIADLKKKVAVSKRSKLSRNKGNIIITPPPNEKGKIYVDPKTKLIQLTVENTNNRAVTLRCVHLGCSKEFLVDDKEYNIVSGKKLELPPHGTVTFYVEFLAVNTGIYVTPVAFMFKFSKKDIPFHIVKYIRAEISDAIIEENQPTAKYVKQEPVVERFDPNVEKIPGEPPNRGSTNYKRKLESYEVPSNLRYAMNTWQLKDLAKELCGGQLTVNSHKNTFSTLLHIEELQMEVDIKRYSMNDGRLQQDGNFLALKVPGLSENRPSLLQGDKLYVRKLDKEGEPEKKKYEGFIHKISLNKVHLKFSRQFHAEFVRGAFYKVDFTFSRTCLQLMHRAVELAKDFLDLIPVHGQPRSEGMVRDGSVTRFYDSKIESNEEQKQAIRNIVGGTSKPYPYIVFGPPGTGKTVTIVEAIKQVLKNNPNSCILACAPSNNAADLILKRVANHNVVPKSKMVRLNPFGRAVSSVDRAIMEFCKKNADGYFYFPQIEDIQNNYRLVVTTLMTAGSLYSMGMEKGHFSYIFIDEAGQATEPECLVPISALLGPDGQLVLAGDPKQLGPVLRSPIAIEFGLNISFLERLMDSQFSCFRKHDGIYNNSIVTKLLNNYRSHPAIIELPNQMFYDNELRYCADEYQRNSMFSWSCLRKKNFPVIFQPVFGEDMREEKSPSFFNPQEVSMVINLVQELTSARGLSLKRNEIGIIAPYHKQVKKIRESLQKKPYKINDIKVGSVEQFQGDEKKVIIISTVRTNKQFLNVDAEFKLGFLKNPKRFNVAITRAKALLIVVGNPNVLAYDEHWRSFIQYCLDNNSFGAQPSGYFKETLNTFTMPDIADRELTTQFERLVITNETLDASVVEFDDEDGEDDVPEWRPPQE